MTKKTIRMTAVLLVLALSFSVFSITTYAGINSSAYIYMTGASVTQGSSAGKINVHYSITGMGMMDIIGVLCIEVYKSNGTLYTTIYGTTSNGLLLNNDFVHGGTYTVNCVAGNSYYCEVTLIAAKNGGGDTRTIRTQTIVAPSSP
jgi:hypothetical protein